MRVELLRWLSASLGFNSKTAPSRHDIDRLDTEGEGSGVDPLPLLLLLPILLVSLACGGGGLRCALLLLPVLLPTLLPVMLVTFELALLSSPRSSAAQLLLTLRATFVVIFDAVLLAFRDVTEAFIFSRPRHNNSRAAVVLWYCREAGTANKQCMNFFSSSSVRPAIHRILFGGSWLVALG